MKPFNEGEELSNARVICYQSLYYFMEQNMLNLVEVTQICFLGAVEYNFNFVPHFTRFHWSNNEYAQI